MEAGATSIDWDGYVLYNPGVMGPLNGLPLTEARLAFKRCMETKAERLEMLGRLLNANGVTMDVDDSAVQKLNGWFYENVEFDPEQPGRLLADWYSVVHDMAMFLGELTIRRHPNLRWEFFTWGRTNVSFQKPVIMGFGTEDPKFRTNIDFERMVAAYAHRIVAGRGSIPTYGTVTVRGTAIDVDALSRDHDSTDATADQFLLWLLMAKERA